MRTSTLRLPFTRIRIPLFFMIDGFKRRGELPVFWLENEAECERLSGEEALPWKKSSKSSAAE
jgi:hypothetical protein